MIPITLYIAACRGNAQNSCYPEKRTINNLEDFRDAMQYDHVSAEYRNYHRSVADFIRADCLMMDCDNKHSDNLSDWVTPETINKTMPGLLFYICYSRNHMKVKDKRSPRPKFHIYFAIDPISDAKAYAALKEKVIAEFPQLHFDTEAKDAARFFFGVTEPEVRLMGGEEI